MALQRQKTQMSSTQPAVSDPVKELLHLLNDDNLDKLENCKLCRGFVFANFSMRWASQGNCGYHSHDPIEKVLFCKKREDLSNGIF